MNEDWKEVLWMFFSQKFQFSSIQQSSCSEKLQTPAFQTIFKKVADLRLQLY